ncbi:MAG: caspase family protein [Cyanobacteria bacterium SZAS LIN-5]|nr:caspase family protein [Cyanobacteria bacterium SZAS LIN-5]
MNSGKYQSVKKRTLASVAAGALFLLSNTFPLAAQSDDSSSTGSGAANSAASTAAKSAGGNYALLIAIDDYISPDINKLNGCNKDIHDITEVLAKNGWPKDAEHIKVLSNHDATKQAIIDNFRTQLVENAKKHPDAFFYFQYSGHGSRWKDATNGDEDGFDETIVPADSRTPDHYDLIDKEIAPLIAELTKYTKNAILTFDSCHSGHIDRMNRKTRALKDDERPIPANLAAQLKKSRGLDDDDNAGGFTRRTDRYICISACLPTETAQETEDPSESERNGLMTRNLITALSKVTPTTTYKELRDMLQKQMKDDNQHPDIVGDLDRAVFGSSADRSDASLRVTKVDKDKKLITIDAGTNIGVTEGSIIAFYKASTLKLEGDKNRLGQGVVTKVMPLSAEVTMPENVSEQDALSAKAIIASSKLKAEPQRVMLEIPSDKKLNTPDAQKVLSTFETSVKDDPIVRIAGRSANPFKGRSADFDLVLANSTFEKFDTGHRVPDAPPKDTPVFYLTDASGEPLFNNFVNQKDPDAATKLLKIVHRKSQQDFLRSLGNQLSPLNNKLKLSVIRVTGYHKDDNGLKVPTEEIRKEDQIASPIFHAGDKFRFAVQNTADVPVYINLLSIGSSGAIDALYDATSKALNPGDTMKTDVLVADYPLGTETVKVIGTTKPADFSVLTKKGLRDAAPTPPGNSALQSMVTRGVRDVRKDSEQEAAKIDLDDWATTNLNYVIKDRPKVASNQ